jgi:hypothetical protein
LTARAGGALEVGQFSLADIGSVTQGRFIAGREDAMIALLRQGFEAQALLRSGLPPSPCGLRRDMFPSDSEGNMADATGLEPTREKSQPTEGKPTCESDKNAETRTGAHDVDKACRELAVPSALRDTPPIVALWPLLPPELRSAILALIRAARPTQS